LTKYAFLFNISEILRKNIFSERTIKEGWI